MNKYIVKLASKIFAKDGYSIVRSDMLEAMRRYTIKVVGEFESVKTQDKIDSIIFSKDRAIQLNAFIESYLTQVDGYGQLYVLYKASPKHAKSYLELKNLYANQDIVFVEELNFREQLNEICRNSDAKLIGFYVDDMIFTQKISYDAILRYNPAEYIVCLSRGKDFTYSQVLGRDMELPLFTPLGDGLYEYRWDSTDEFNDWTYPLGVSAYFYSRHEVVAMLSTINYKAPNSLEEAMQTMIPYFKSRKGLCTEKVACCCVPVNLVQEECINPVTGYASVDDLLKIWDEGMKIDISKFHDVGINGVNMNYQYIKR